MANEIEQKPMPQDMSLEEQEQLNMFLNNGCPGLSKMRDSDIFQWFELYMAGRSYSEIAVATKKKKEYILFMAYKQNWLDKKMNHFDDLLSGMEEKLQQTKLESINTISTIVNALGKFYGDQFLKYLTTKDPSVINSIDTKMLSQYYKSVEALDKLMGRAASNDGDGEGRGPLVNFNLGAGATVSQIDDKTVEVTDNTAGDLLKLLASMKKKDSESQ